MSDGARTREREGNPATGPAANLPATGHTLHRRVMERYCGREPFAAVFERHLANAPTIEASSAFDLFWDSALAPPAESISLQAFPKLTAAFGAKGGLFIEGARPARPGVFGEGAAFGSRVGFALQAATRDRVQREELPHFGLLALTRAPAFVSAQLFWEDAATEVRTFPAAFVLPVDPRGRAALIGTEPAAILAPGGTPYAYVADPAAGRDDYHDISRLAIAGALFTLSALAAAPAGLVGLRPEAGPAPRGRHPEHRYDAVMDTTLLADRLQRRGKAARRGLAAAIQTIAREISG